MLPLNVRCCRRGYLSDATRSKGRSVFIGRFSHTALVRGTRAFTTIVCVELLQRVLIRHCYFRRVVKSHQRGFVLVPKPAGHSVIYEVAARV